MKLFNDTNFRAIQEALNQKFQRHVVLTGNIANASTPKYRARDVDFGDELSKIYGAKDGGLKKTHASHMDVNSTSSTRIVYDNSGTVRADGNNVDIDQAMGKLSGNAKSYESTATLLSMKLRVFRSVARGGGGV